MAPKSPRGIDTLARVVDRLIAHALTFPEAHEDNPWGERVAKVGGKVFVFFGVPSPGELGLSVKLPHSRFYALDLPFAEPTGYGLGKHGWVTARFPAGSEPPVDVLEMWIEESYKAVAPKKLVARLQSAEEGQPTVTAARKVARKKPAAKKPAAKKPAATKKPKR